jgi:putative ABC transport system permease protein
MISIRRNNFKLAYRSLQAAKARSFLTMLGTIIGVTAVVLVICIGQGVKQQIAGQLGHYGKSVFVVQPGAAPASTAVLASLSGGSNTLLTAKDLKTVQKTDGVAYAVPLSTASGSMSGDHTVTSPFIVATTADFPNIIDQSMASGGFFDPEDGSKTVVLGASIAQKLFNDNAPLGQALTWRGQRFIVAGVFNDFVAPPLSLEANFNNAVFVPYSTAQSLTGGILGVYQILAKSDTPRDTARVVSSVDGALVAQHGGAHDVTVVPASSASTGSNQTIHLLTLLVAGAAVIALIVGGVGVMDVMLVSVTERMHEIGLRKAIGATNAQIMRQFVAEAFVLSGMGALIGVTLACIIVGLLRAYTSLQAVLVWQALVIAPLVAIAIGLFFGSMPALKAARKDPIDALRHV